MKYRHLLSPAAQRATDDTMRLLEDHVHPRIVAVCEALFEALYEQGAMHVSEEVRNAVVKVFTSDLETPKSIQ